MAAAVDRGQRGGAWSLALVVALAAGCVAQAAGFGSSVSGGISNLTLSAGVKVAVRDAGRTANVYLAAKVGRGKISVGS